MAPDVRLSGFQGIVDAKGRPLCYPGKDLADVDFIGQAFTAHGDGRHQVESHDDKVVEVVPGKRFPIQVGVNAADALEAVRGCSELAHLGDDNAVVVPDDDGCDPSFTVDEQTELAVDFKGEAADIEAEFRREDILRWRAAPVQVFDTPDLILFQPFCCLLYTSDAADECVNV